ncbi:MAG: alkaline phosphatase family protein, partial [Thermodesulfobacteriota bacterium]|nr:alkaline phosphatase family protein [Thermodesulfobacteriota bacterium]
MKQKVLIIGLDCAEPSLVFHQWRANLPNISGLMAQGLYGPLTSTIPPVTVPAWASMLTGKDPGQLGLYGFRNRRDRSYAPLALASSASLKEKTLDQILSRQRLTSILLGVPLTYPPRPLRGRMVSGPLTPNKKVA